MIVPDHWAEARRQHRGSGKQTTVRRYGWSTTTPDDALAMAEARADEALVRILAGAKLDRREPKVPYNGAAGLPIREEVLARHGEQVITRNAYGAHCLNSPNALFADIDFHAGRPAGSARLVFLALAVASAATGWLLGRWGVGAGLLFASLIVAAPLASLAHRVTLAARGGAERMARDRLLSFLTRHPAWNVRVYRTPAGCRLLATHQPFEAGASDVQDFFSAVSADPLYVRMCTNQHCFRARLTAKPWRIGIGVHMRPRPGVWPVHAAHRAVRQQWIDQYEARAFGYAACRYVESLGSGVIDATLAAVVDLHDIESGALRSDATLA